MRRLICMLTAVLLLASGVPAFAEGTRDETAEAQLIRDMVLYYGCHGEAADDEIGALLGALKDLDTDRGELWEGIMAYWRYADTELTLYQYNYTRRAQKCQTKTWRILENPVPE